MKEMYLADESKVVIELFKSRFGEKHINNVKEKLYDVRLLIRDNPYDIYLGTVTSTGEVIINTMVSTINIEDTITHELMHKVNNVKDNQGEEISLFALCPEEYKEYMKYLFEYTTEWVTQEILNKNDCTYLVDGERDIVKTKGNRTNYSKGTNIIKGLKAIIGEEELLNLFVGETGISDFIDNYEKQYGKGTFLEFVKLVNQLGTKGEKEGYSNAVESILDTYIKKQNLKTVYTKEQLSEMAEEIQSLITILPIHLTSEKDNLDDKIIAIKKKHEKECEYIGVEPGCFEQEEVPEDKKTILLSVENACNLYPDRELKIFGYIIKCDETKDIRNNFYRILKVQQESGQRIEDAILKTEDKYLMRLLEKIEMLSPYPQNDIDIEQYRDVYKNLYKYLDIEKASKFEKGEKGTVVEYKRYRQVFSTIQKNSIYDVKNKEYIGDFRSSVNLYNLLLENNTAKNERLLQLVEPYEDIENIRRFSKTLAINESFYEYYDSQAPQSI